MQAKSKQRYCESWHSHINELKNILCEAKVPMKQWDPLLAPLRSAVNTAADNLEAEGFWPE